MAKKKDNEFFAPDEITIAGNGSFTPNVLRTLSSTPLNSVQKDTYTLNPSDFSSDNIQNLGFSRNGNDLVISYVYKSNSTNNPSENSVTIKDYFDHSDENILVEDVSLGAFNRKTSVNIAGTDISQIINPDGDDWKSIIKYLNGQDYNGQVNYNPNTGKLSLTKFELGKGTLDEMTAAGEEYLSEYFDSEHQIIALSATKGNNNCSVNIGGQLRYFTTNDIRLQGLALIGDIALVETTQANALFSYSGKYYTYNEDKLPISGVEYEEVTNATDIANGNYNAVFYENDVPHYYNYVTNLERFNRSPSVLYTLVDKSEATDSSGNTKRGYIKLEYFKINGADDSRYLKYTVAPTTVEQDVVLTTNSIKFNNAEFTDMVIGKPENTNNLMIYYNNTQDSICLNDWFTTASTDRVSNIIDSTGAQDNIVDDTPYNKTIIRLTNDDDTYSLTNSKRIIMGLKGDDSIDIHYGLSNTFLFSSGDGNDLIRWNGGDGHAGAGSNILRFTDVKFEDMKISVNPNNSASLKISYTENDSVSLYYFYSKKNKIDKIIDMTGTEYSIVNDAPNYNKLFGTDENDNINSIGSNIQIIGLKGNDYIYIDNASDNTFLFSSGDGNDIINWSGSDAHTGAGSNILRFTDVKFEDMKISVNPNNSANLKISYTENDSVSLYYFYSKKNKIDKIIDMTGTEYSIVNNAPNYNKLLGTDGNDNINSIGSNIQIIGLKGNDYIYIDNASDNTFLFSSGDGNDIINWSGGDGHAGAGSNILRFTDVKFEDMKISVNPNNSASLKISYTENDSVSLYYFYSKKNKIDKIIDMTGTEYSIVNDAPNYNKLFGTDENDNINSIGSNIQIIGLKGNDSITINDASDNTLLFSSGDGNDLITWDGGGGHTNAGSNILRFNDAKFEDMKIGVNPNNTDNLKISYTENDSVSLFDFYLAQNKIDKLTDSTGITSQMLGGSNTSKDDNFSANISDNRLAFDFFTTDNDTLTISDTNANGLHVAGNFKADGTLDGNGLRVLSDDNYAAWKADTTSINGGIQIVSELGSVENIKSADDKTVIASELAQLRNDVTAWLTSHTDYADVSSAIAHAGTDSSVSTLVAIFDNFNQTAWSN